SFYNAFQMEVNRRLADGLAFTTTYTLARNLADNGGPNSTGFPRENAGGPPTALFKPNPAYRDAYPPPPHSSITTLVWDLPFGQGRKLFSSASPVANGFVNGWQLAAILLLESGPHLTPYIGGIDPSGTGSGLSRNQHPDRIGDGSIDNPTAA